MAPAFLARKVGTFGEVATFSFYPTKNLGALGDGGMLATQDAKLGADIAALRQYGWRTHYISDAVGVNSRLDELQAAILRVKLRHLDAQNARDRPSLPPTMRRCQGHRWQPPHGGTASATSTTSTSCARRSVPQCNRDCARQGLAPAFTTPSRCICSRHIEGRVALGPSGCRITEDRAAQVLSLPMYPELTDAQVAQVCEALRRA